MPDIDSVRTDEVPPEFLLRSTGQDPKFTTAAAVRFLARAGEDQLKLHNRIKGGMVRGLIRHTPGASRTSPAALGLDDLVTTSILSKVFDCGISSAEISEATSLACYAWHDNYNPAPFTPEPGRGCPAEYVSPAWAALFGVSRGESWVFRLTVYSDFHTNRPTIVATVHNAEAPPPPAGDFLPPTLLPSAHLEIPLDTLLQPLMRAFPRAGG